MSQCGVSWRDESCSLVPSTKYAIFRMVGRYTLLTSYAIPLLALLQHSPHDVIIFKTVPTSIVPNFHLFLYVCEDGGVISDMEERSLMS